MKSQENILVHHLNPQQSLTYSLNRALNNQESLDDLHGALRFKPGISIKRTEKIHVHHITYKYTKNPGIDTQRKKKALLVFQKPLSVLNLMTRKV
jgi:hypothetical protein